MEKSYTVAFVSLGCAKNLVNTEQMAARVSAAGMCLLPDADGADAVVLNTCGFIDSAKSEAIEQVLELAALKSEGRLGKILMAGCLAERYREEILTELPEVDGLLGCGSFDDVVDALYETLSGGQPVYFGDISAPQQEQPRLVSTQPWTAYLKIAEGCDNRCAFCVIPSLRGRYRSRKLEDILQEAQALVQGGVKELIVIAQDITRYGTDLYGRRSLAELLEALCKLEVRWIRLHYLYPDAMDDALIDLIAREEKILRYLDIPIQHINDGLLRKMNRRGSGQDIRRLLRQLREKIPGLVLRTSIITGLPGEGEAEFEELCVFLKEARIERAGVFPFSPQEGTAAAAMPGQVEPELAQQRAQLLSQLQALIMDERNEALVGQVLEVLCEGFDEDACLWHGRSYAESPEIDGRILFSAPDARPGEFYAVSIVGALDGEPVGEIC